MIRSLFALSILAAMMYVCGIGNDSQKPATLANSNGPPAKTKAVDKKALLDELVAVERELIQASVNGDITLLAQRTTDDFEVTGVDGKVQNKNEALADVKKERNIKSWTINEPELVSSGDDTAVLRYTLSLTLKNGRSGKARVTDSFVRRNGEWLIKNEQQTMLR